MKIFILKCNNYDVINETNWSEDWIKLTINQIGKSEYYFDEIDKCVYERTKETINIR